MHLLGRKMRRLVSVLGSAMVASLLVSTVTSASATISRATVMFGGPRFVLSGTVAGKIKTIQADQMLTFVFTETNNGPGSAPEDLVITKVTHARVLGSPPCVLPDGFAINSDNPSCEPGFVAPGQSVSMVITTRVTEGAGTTASVRLCLTNENTGIVAPCKTISVKVA